MPVISSQHSSDTSGTSDCTNSIARLGIQAQGQQIDRRVERQLREQLRVAHRGQRVQIGDEVIGFVFALQIDVLPDGAEIVAPVKSARRLNAGKHTHNGR